ncbi:MAG: SPOR domain-containing protein [Rhodospirillales bacterium]|nr:SPOR domain-containing protein [Rhodospirillales bacterium]
MLALTGCAQAPSGNTAAASARVPAPTFAVGDSFTWSNPQTTWTVAGMAGGLVQWRNERGEEASSTYDPLLPPLSWATQDGSGKYQFQAVEGEIFPLLPGKTMSYTVVGDSDREPHHWQLAWQCAVGARTRVRVPAGEFETYPVTCRSEVAEQIFQYAPAVNHYVLRIDLSEDIEPVRHELLSFDLVKTGRQGPPTSPVFDEGTAAEIERLHAQVEQRETAKRNGVRQQPLPAPVSMQPVPPAVPLQPPPPAALTAPAPVAAAVAPPASPSGMRYGAQLASYRQKVEAQKGWEEAKARFPDLLGPLQPVLVPVDLGAKGHWLRLYAGPFQAIGEAETLCGKLRGRGQHFCQPAQISGK